MTEPSGRNPIRSFLVPLLIAAVIVIAIFLLFGQMEEEALALLHEWKSKAVQFSLFSGLILVSDILLPVPSSVVMYLNGFVLGMSIGTILSFVSLMISSVIGYGLGRLPYFRSRAAQDRTGAFMEKYGPYAILLTRGIPILSESVCFVCGYRKMNFRSYIWLNALGFLPICVLYAYMGQVASDANAFVLALGLSIVVTVLFWLFGWVLDRRRATP